jgi:hypothetical protein
MTFIEALLVGRSIKVNQQDKVIESVDDFIYRERSVGILNDYAVVTADNETYVIFDSGEIQDDNGVIVGETDSF